LFVRLFSFRVSFSIGAKTRSESLWYGVRGAHTHRWSIDRGFRVDCTTAVVCGVIRFSEEKVEKITEKSGKRQRLRTKSISAECISAIFLGEKISSWNRLVVWTGVNFILVFYCCTTAIMFPQKTRSLFIS